MNFEKSPLMADSSHLRIFYYTDQYCLNTVTELTECCAVSRVWELPQ